MRARNYDPAVGRFASEDPARDGWNWFEYAHSAPTVYVDPTGRFAWLEAVVGVILGVAFVWGFELGIEAGENKEAKLDFDVKDKAIAAFAGLLAGGSHSELVGITANLLRAATGLALGGATGFVAAVAGLIYASFVLGYSVGFYYGVMNSAPGANRD